MKLELSDQAIEPLEERESIEQRVAQSLRALIVAGQLPEGTQLVQRELATRLGVSQTPVRASLGRLEREGFVAVGSTGRAFVSRLTREDFEEIYAARLGLEGLAARLGAEAVGPDELASMRKTLGKLERAAADAGRRRLPRAPLGVLRHLLPGERPAPPRRGGRAALLALRALQPARARDGATVPGVARPLPPPSSRTARRTTGSPPSAPSRTACAGRSTASRAGCPPRRSSRDASPSQELREALVEALGEDARVSDGDSERDLHAADMTFHRPQRPDLVVYPSSTEEVSRVLAIASERRVPVTPFGAGSSLEGHVIPTRGGISLDLSRMNRVLEIAAEDLSATVQAGVTRMALERAAGEHGLFFPVDPGADATLGGMAATNAAGTTTIRYGKMRANVLALEAVLADGTIVRTGSRARKTSAGYDLTGLLVGSEGTLAVITEVRVRLYGIPGAHRRAAHLLPDDRRGVPDRRRRRRRRLGGHAARAARRLDARGDQRLPRVELPGGPVPASSRRRERRRRSRPTSRWCASWPRRRARPRSSTSATRPGAPSSGPRGTTRRTRRPRPRRGGTSVRPTPASRSPSWPAPSRLPAPRSSASASTRPSSATPATATSTSACSSTPTMRTSWLSPTSSSSGWSSTRSRAAAPARASTASAWARSQALELEHGDLVPLMREIKRVFDPHGIMNPGKVFTT